MKPLSIKTKITVWYTGLILVILCIIGGSVAFSTDKFMALELQSELEDEVYDVIEDIQAQSGVLDLHKLKYFDDGISISLYSQEQQHLAGQVPAGFPAAVPFRPQQVQTISAGAHNWLVYDFHSTGNAGEPLWVRGVVSLSSSYETRNQILLVYLLLFPFLLLLSGLGGWLITKSAFQPVSLIRRIASEIQSSGDLSKRIHLTGSKDEIYELAQTFDYMLEQLESSFKAERQFTADASHELRTPVSVILSHAEYGLTQTANPQEMAESLQVIQQQAGKMRTLIASLLLLARADQNTEPLEFETVNLSEITEIVIEELSLFAQQKNIVIHTEIAPGLFIRADQTSMMRLLLNLLQNAIRYGRENGWVKISLAATDEGIAGSVEDNGIGIAPKDLPNVWMRFYQADPARGSAGESGAGLGLPIVKWIVERHGGKISVTSRLGQGTCFSFLLPIKK